MATRASTKRKRSSLPVSPPSGGRTVHSRGAQPEEEEQTLVEVDNEVPWALALKPQREAGQFIDITLSVGGRRIEAHRSILAGFSPYFAGLLTSGLAESAAQSQELQIDLDMDSKAVEAVVDCMYSGKLSLSSSTVTSVIHVANLLQISAMEKAAGAFLLSTLEPCSAADALRFAEQRVACGEHARMLHEDCVAYAVQHFQAVSREPAFVYLACETLVRLIASDDLPVVEPDVLSAVRSWVEHDADGRKGALKTLLPLVRWPQLPVEARRHLKNEPLFLQLMAGDNECRSLGFGLLLELDPDLRDGSCPRLKRRKGVVRELTEYERQRQQNILRAFQAFLDRYS